MLKAGARGVSSVPERAERLAELVAEQGLDLLIVGDLVRPGDSRADAIADLRWLTGFTGTSGLAVVGAGSRHLHHRLPLHGAGRARGRQRLRAGHRPRPDCSPSWPRGWRGRVGFDDSATSVASLRKLEAAIEEGGAGRSWSRPRVWSSGCGGARTTAELEAIAAAARLADEVYESVLEGGLVGRTERQIALAAEERIRELGAEPSFPAIVAAGENGALPHAEPSEREIGDGELVVWDMGAMVDGYCSDCTRTFAAGEPGEEAREVYELVRRAQAAGLEAIGPGVGGEDADEAARDADRDAGYGEHFGHGLGHGVGLEVHEAPRLGPRSEDVLAAGDVVTVEPGVYLPGRFGVRIEDLVLVTDDGLRNLSSLSKDLRVVE